MINIVDSRVLNEEQSNKKKHPSNLILGSTFCSQPFIREVSSAKKLS
jgi:hypothetical protein